LFIGVNAMQCKQLELALEQEDLARLSESARAHVAGCGFCQGLIADLTAITRVARHFPAEVEPPSHIWTSLRAQLESEGIIKAASAEQPGVFAASNSWWDRVSILFGTRAFATAALGVLIVAGVVLQRQHIFDRHAVPSLGTRNFYGDTSAVLRDDEAKLSKIKLAANAFTVDHSLRKNLDIVNNFIADCEQRVKDEPQDDLSHDYLSVAYQQKPELLSTMMERGE
jgi:hypothetical protein